MKSKTLPGLIFPFHTRSISSGRKRHRGGATVEVDVSIEKLLAVKLDTVGDADVAHRTARARGANSLHHRLLGADTFEHRVGADAIGQLLGAVHALVAAAGNNVGRAEVPGERLARLVTAHRDDPPCAHLPGGEHTEEADRAVTDDYDRRAWLHIRRAGGEPAGAHDVGERQKARSYVIRGNIREATRVPSASGTLSTGAWAVPTNSRCWQDD